MTDLILSINHALACFRFWLAACLAARAKRKENRDILQCIERWTGHSPAWFPTQDVSAAPTPWNLREWIEATRHA